LVLQQKEINLQTEAAKYINENVKDTEAALQGARDIIAETINEDDRVRAKMRKLFEDKATLQSKVVEDKKDEAAKYKDYFDFSEPIHKIPSHRILAVLRGFLEGFLRMSISTEEEDGLYIIEGLYVTGSLNSCVEQVKKAGKEAYKRLLQPSLESEFRTALKLKADEEAINVFAENLRQLLLSPPLGSKKILAIDPGYRTGVGVAGGEIRWTILRHRSTCRHTRTRSAGRAFRRAFRGAATFLPPGAWRHRSYSKPARRPFLHRRADTRYETAGAGD